jgi:23S rRNA (pseudouridine1915-N3)-methyltransferase
MKIVLLAIGKTSEAYLKEGIDKFTKRLGHYIPFELRIIQDVKTSRGISSEKQKQMEGELILNNISSGDHVVLLDERGKQHTSREFANYLDRKMSIVPKNLYFIIGGPYGFSKEVYERANELISLSSMTFSHEMVRLFMTEQIYRAMTILRGEPYHHD